MYLSDYDFYNVNIYDIIIEKNDVLIPVTSITCSYNLVSKKIELIVLTTNSLFKIYLSNLNNIHKTILTSVILDDNTEVNNVENLILLNKSFIINSNDNKYRFVLKWNGKEFLNNKYESFKFNEKNNYLYWYKMSTLNLENIMLNSEDLINTLKIQFISSQDLLFLTF